MKAPTSGVDASTAWDGYPSLGASASERNLVCPWPCLKSGKVVSLQTVDGYVAATWCRECDQAVTRGQWLEMLENAAGDRA